MADNDVALKILLIEDKDTCARTMIRIANDHGLEIIHKRSLEEAIDLFDSEEGNIISGAILDIKGSIKKGDVPEQAFLSEALLYFARKRPKMFPLVALTGEADIEEIKRNHKELLVYEKTKNEKELCEYLKLKALQYINARIRLQHWEAFEILTKYFGDIANDAADRLEHCLINGDRLINMGANAEKEIGEIIKSVGLNLRQLVEQMYIAASKNDSKLVPPEFIKKEKIRDEEFEIKNSSILWHLKGRRSKEEGFNKGDTFIEHNSYEDSLFNFVYKGCSNILHYTNKDADKNYSKYIVPALLSAYIEMLYWLKRKLRKEANR